MPQPADSELQKPQVQQTRQKVTARAQLARIWDAQAEPLMVDLEYQHLDGHIAPWQCMSPAEAGTDSGSTRAGLGRAEAGLG